MKWKVKADKRGGVTWPKAMRDEMGILPGGDFGFRVTGKRIFVTRRGGKLTFEMFLLPEQAP